MLEQLVADKTLITADMIEQVKRYKRLDGAEAALRALAAANFAGGRQDGRAARRPGGGSTCRSR